jgi:predicted ATPase
LLCIAHEHLLVLVLEDLHAADDDTLGLLQHVWRALRRGHCLLVLTHRLPAPATLEVALAGALREANALTLPLRAFDRSEATALISARCGAQIPARLCELLFA